MEKLLLLLLFNVTFGQMINSEVCDKPLSIENLTKSINTCTKLDQPVNIKKQMIYQNPLQNVTNLSAWLIMVRTMWNDFPIYKSGNSVKTSHWLSNCLLTNEDFKFTSGLQKTEDGRLNGNGIISFKNGSICHEKFGILEINGTFYKSVLHGMASIHFNNFTTLRVPFNNGVKSGIGRVFRCIYDCCDFETEEWNKQETLGKVKNTF